MFDINFKHLVKTNENLYSINIKSYKQIVGLLSKLKFLEPLKADKITLEVNPNETMSDFFASSGMIRNFIKFFPNVGSAASKQFYKIRPLPVSVKFLTEDEIEETTYYLNFWFIIDINTKEKLICKVNSEGHYISSDEPEVVKKFCELIGIEY